MISLRHMLIGFLGAASLLLVAGCSSSSGPANDSAMDSSVGCGTEGQTYAANMLEPGTLGKYTFTLVDANPAPPSGGLNQWTVKITGATGTDPSPSATQLFACPFMPRMGHASDQTPQFAANADGTFTVSDIDLFMPGLWTVTFSVLSAPPAQGQQIECLSTPPTSALDTGTFSFCTD
jgi:hypothetical protein